MNSAEWLISVSKDFFRIEQEMRKLIKSDEKIPVSTLHKGFSDFIFFFFFFLFSSLKYILKFIYSEKATKFCQISTSVLTGTTQDKSKVEISHNFVAFSEYMNFSNRNISRTGSFPCPSSFTNLCTGFEYFSVKMPRDNIQR